MSHGNSPGKAAAKRQWERFVASNGAVIAATGLPDVIFHSIDRFDELLSRGRVDLHLDPPSSGVESLNPSQYHALVMLTESYFAAGYEWFTPFALRSADRQSLARRFAG
jgi:hypothetical protein